MVINLVSFLPNRNGSGGAGQSSAQPSSGIFVNNNINNVNNVDDEEGDDGESRAGYPY